MCEHILNSCFFKAPYGCMSDVCFHESLANVGKSSHCYHKTPLSFVSCTFQNNIINAKFIQGCVLKSQHGASIILWSSVHSKGCLVVIVICHLPLKCVFHVFHLIECQTFSYWESQIHLMIFPPHSNGNGACDKTVILT